MSRNFKARYCLSLSPSNPHLRSHFYTKASAFETHLRPLPPHPNILRYLIQRSPSLPPLSAAALPGSGPARRRRRRSRGVTGGSAFLTLRRIRAGAQAQHHITHGDNFPPKTSHAPPPSRVAAPSSGSWRPSPRLSGMSAAGLGAALAAGRLFWRGAPLTPCACGCR